ncbi:DUF6233 domain-containing protein [Streptomyces sp. NPDC002308]
MPDDGGISPLAANRAVEAHLEWQLRQVRRRIQQLKREAAEAERRAAASRAAGYTLQPKGATGSVEYAILHRGDCPLGSTAKAKAILVRQAQLALDEDYVRCCEVCDPRAALTAGQ